MRVALLGVALGFAVSTFMYSAAPVAAQTDTRTDTSEISGATAQAEVFKANAKKNVKKKRHSKRRVREKRPDAITLWEAQLREGDLIIVGHTPRSGATVSLDGQFTQISDYRRRFVFRVPYRPQGCAVTLSSGALTRQVVVANCAATGSAGETGPQGPVGAQGPRGETGAPGAAGQQGATGAQGSVGPAGPRGETGAAGTPGLPGMAGTAGAAGPKGEPGAAGPKGEPGAPGLSIREAKRDCAVDSACALSCAEDERALNAICPSRAPAALTSARDVSCGTGPAGAIVAYCAK